ncbi:MAG: Gfo/Idh/MocA family oxidoreductase, partial [Flavobacteriaceae bacterium]|nr:Gfo/Idh/MocA family oxidoreductase [Flavobacteriaceae bacterium]
MNKIRVGVVGLGRLGFTHAENITTTKNASLVALCSHSEEELKKAKEKLGVTNCFTDIIKMVEIIDLDAVILVSPSNFHSEQSIYCLQKGLHVFCEKPLATTINACNVVARAIPGLIFA